MTWSGEASASTRVDVDDGFVSVVSLSWRLTALALVFAGSAAGYFPSMHPRAPMGVAARHIDASPALLLAFSPEHVATNARKSGRLPGRQAISAT